MPKQTMMVYEIAVKLTGWIYFALLTVISIICGTTLRKRFKTEYHSMFPNKKNLMLFKKIHGNAHSARHYVNSLLGKVDCGQVYGNM